MKYTRNNAKCVYDVLLISYILKRKNFRKKSGSFSVSLKWWHFRGTMRKQPFKFRDYFSIKVCSLICF